MPRSPRAWGTFLLAFQPVQVLILWQQALPEPDGAVASVPRCPFCLQPARARPGGRRASELRCRMPAGMASDALQPLAHSGCWISSGSECLGCPLSASQDCTPSPLCSVPQIGDCWHHRWPSITPDWSCVRTSRSWGRSPGSSLWCIYLPDGVLRKEGPGAS